ncbi:MAG: acyl-CoA synthetase [Pseudomonadota bacterium]
MAIIQSLADIEAFEVTPAEARWRGKSTYDMIARTANKFADLPALKFQYTPDVDEDPHVITYRELLSKIHQTANALFASGVKTGGVTSILLPSLPQIHYGLWGGQALGIVGPVNPMLEPDAIKDILLHSETEALIVEGPHEKSDVWDKALQIADDIPSLKIIVQVNIDGAPDTLPDRSAGGCPIVDFDTLIAEHNGDALDFDREIKPTDIAAYFHTGGTTGRPKLAQHTQANQVHLSSMMADMFDYDENTVAFGGLPLFHVNSFFNAGINLFACGGHAVFATSAGFRNKQVVANLWQLLEKYKITYFATVPTVVSSLLEVPINDADLSNMDYIICGAAPIAPQVFKQFQDVTQINVVEAYGMTEGTLFSAGNPKQGEKRVGSIGIRIPYQPMKCVILDDDNNYVRDCQVNEIGTIVIQGPNVFPGYKDPNKNKGVFIEGGWLISGDLARMDADGYFWMTGRSKDLIIRGGHNIDPKAIEDVLSDHPAVSLAAAIGQPDAYAGELPCAYVSLADNLDGPPPTSEELRTFAKDNIGERAAVPVHVEVLETMPVTAVGKIFKPDLRALSIERVLLAAIKPDAGGVEIDVRNDEKKGLVAHVSGIEPSQTDAVRTKLDTFTVPYELT